jgi:carbon monoxide dehydrogenase subunit G
MTRVFRASAIGLLISGFIGTHPELDVAAAPQHTRSVHVTVIDEAGVPVTDLTAAHFEIKEDGKVREIGSAALTPVPIRMTILVADEGTGAFQQALVTLIQPLTAIAEFSLVSVVAQPEKVLDFTSDPEKVVAGVEQLGQRGGRPGSAQILEAISESIDAIAAPAKRPVIVVMRLSGGASSSLRPDTVREALRKTGATLYVFSPTGATGAGGGAPMTYAGAGGVARADYAAAETTYRSRNLESVINDGSKQTGGRHEQFGGETILKMMEQLAQELLSQYQLTYTLPAGVKPGDRLEVSTTRRGARVYAPNRIVN